MDTCSIQETYDYHLILQNHSPIFFQIGGDKLTYMEPTSVRLTKEAYEQVLKRGKPSQIIREMVEQSLYDGATLYKKKVNLERKIKDAKNDIVDLELELSQVNEDIQHMEARKSYRPDGYHDCFERLSNMASITSEDIKYQAKLLDVDVTVFKYWLFDDGIFERLLSD